jgi:hypothetical protein
MRKNLLLEIHGELDDRARPELEAHLRECRGCRNERERLSAFLQEIREAAEPPELSARETRAMVAAVRKRWKDRPVGWFERLRRGGRLRFIPIAAAASAALIVGFLAHRTFTLQGGFGDSVGQQQVTQQDLEVIRHLDLLKDLDAIQKLVRVVDENGKAGPADDSGTDTHGMPQTGNGVPYA